MRKRRRLPIFTTLIVGLSLLLYATPALATGFVYDRAAILSGQVWRAITGHLVHFSHTHLLLDLGAFGVAGVITETRGYKPFALLCAVAAVTVSTALLVAYPGMLRYGGLSGLTYAAFVYLALHALREAPPWRYAGTLVLLVLAAKLTFEMYADRWSIARFNDNNIVPVPLSHMTGALTAVVVWFVTARRRTDVRHH